MKRVELVFRTVGERTSDVALELAVQAIQPQQVHVIDNVRPFAAAVDAQLRLDHRCDVVVYVDADCLILDDMRPFLDWNERPYVDCYVHDRFREHIHCGVHITRIDLVRNMQAVPPPTGDMRYVLRPESRLRNIALRGMGLNKSFKRFRILHDHFQWYHDVWAKYALRELRSRTAKQRARLGGAMARWNGSSPEFDVARAAVAHAQQSVPDGAPPTAFAQYIERLSPLATAEVRRLGLPEQGPLDLGDVERREAQVYGPREAAGAKVFGIGLSRTGTRSLTSALSTLGLDVVHYPTDPTTYYELAAAHYDLTLLRYYDGITDITVSPYFAQLDQRFPEAKFILTVRDKESWLRSTHNHWWGRPAFDLARTAEQKMHMKVRRLLRSAVYGCYDYSPERFSWVYDQHVDNVKRYFADRPGKLLVLDICGGDGWEPLCDFLGRAVPAEPFPHKGNKLSLRMADPDIRD